MKKKIYLNAGIIVLLWLACDMFYAQKYNLRTEVLVYIMPDSLELPVHEKGKLGLLRANVKSLTLAATLTKTKATGIAKAFPTWTNKDSIVTRYDGEQVQAPPFHRIFTLTFNSEKEADSAITVLKQSTAVIFAEKHTEPTLDNDQFYVNGTQWYLNNDGRNGGIAGADINAEGAWAVYTGSSTNKIAIIDTGVELTHEDLSGKVTGENHFGDSHGTMVAGVAAAKANNTHGIRGVDWNAQIISKNISDIYGYYIGDAAMAQKIMDAVNEEANVLNRSGSSPDYSSTLAMAFAYVYKMNRVSVATMGNTGIQQVRYPAALPNVIAVGATQNNDLISGFSTTGNHIDVVAPGGSGWGGGNDIFTTTIGNTYDFAAGTSFSAPQVTGLASLMKGYEPNLSNDDIRQIIRLSADDNIVPGYDPVYGYGRINAGRALSYLTNPYTLVQNTASSGTVISTSNQYVAQFISAPGLPTSNYLVKRIEIQKTVTLPDNVYNVTGAWGRGVFTSGWSAASPNFGEGFCEVVPGSLTGTSMTLRTYVYQVWSIIGSYLGYYPTSPSNATFAYSVLGLEKPTLSGPSTICNQDTFTIINPPSGATITWSASNNNLTLVSGQGTSSAVFSKNSNGLSQVNAVISTGGTTINLSLNDIVVGIPPVQRFKVTNMDIYPYVPVYILPDKMMAFLPYTPVSLIPEHESLNTSLEHSVQTSGNFSYTKSTDPLDPWITFHTPNSPTMFWIDYRYRNACGWSPWYRFNGFSKGSRELFALYPNPATDLLTIDLREAVQSTDQSEEHTDFSQSTDSEKTTYPYTIQLWHERNGMVREIKSTERVTHISLLGLPKGMYFVHVIKEGEVVQKQILWVR